MLEEGGTEEETKGGEQRGGWKRTRGSLMGSCGDEGGAKVKEAKGADGRV